MNSKTRLLAIALAACAFALPLSAYDNFVTHPDLTILATQKSALYVDGSIMFNLGLYPAANQQFIYGARFPEYRIGTAYYSLSEFIGEGAYDEDSGTTPRHHFYDPHFERALTFGSNHKSWEWALEEPDTDLFQSWSLRDAHEDLHKALTFNEGTPAEAHVARGRAIAEMFLSLGHVMHHIQDMAQPQHVRNDMHLDRIWALFLDPFGDLYNPSRYEAYTMNRRDAVRQIAAGASPLDLSSGQFRIGKDFWKNPAGTGIAERTNRDFVSAGTNFVEGGSTVTRGGYPLPLAGIGTEYTLESLYAASGVAVPAEIQSMCGTPATGCTMIMVSTATTPKASTFSIFDQDLRRNNITVQWDGFTPTLTRVLYSLNRFNFDDFHQTLISRAVSYSAGFLDHFFRGKLEVFRPSNGPFAVADHSANEGFSTIRVRVQNATPREALSQGTLRAIACFHRNSCYQADLTGEFTLNEETGAIVPPPCGNYRSNEEHLRMTAEEPITFEEGEMKEMTFTFSEPIPLDATDLILQVYYRGLVGIEENSFAIGAVDLSEPTYFSVMNATDVFELSANGFYYWQEIIDRIAQSPYNVIDLDGSGTYTPGDVPVTGGDIIYEISLDGQKVADVTLPQGRFARIAALVSPFGAELTLRTSGQLFNNIRTYQMSGKSAQYDPTRNAYVVSTMHRLRNQSLHNNSVTYWHYYPTTGTPLNRMPISKAADPTIPVQVQMSPP